MIFRIVNVDSLIIYFGDKIDEDIALKIKKIYHSLRKLNLDGLIEIIPSYTSIFITFDIFKYDFETLKNIIEQNINLDIQENFDEKIITVDVYYGTEVGFDLIDMSSKTKLSIEEIIQIHSNKLYDVYAIGFLPGFAYLASVDERIALPRLSTPRKIVPKGSVAIADTQTAIYPQQSPGGWNIVGKTVFELFDKKLDNLSPLNVGDKVKFNPISKEEFLNKGGIL
ncbi:allophanate hydrolase, subunit 1 [Arcobacter venerupis]|uniref:Allophanate hydrolase, subunit 1 n=1 Tax=Arcobacter venerupis TaxID=1054033 RepID=A0AAE7B8Y6_9BACT|nr:5-oxoprolinase subunit PxpB [Arcobacter venerupis]QKF67653.1 allophanate hydrolase, subunit 1 [Arcobacter venerupis]RWS49188.1 allophanate hydrolase [Arcobacter venerupis]